ncbi:PREDICTED: uncharacterized protein LOC108369544 isoform X1 [Rhagoletis zephyria]|uniref:uncharacterized protein LOC108369544 isoform X1 n=2 Tax=Rhagoletis zephyria TaxID=28612 RepID=UPI0008117481|nr:PREDICTED: uncharacterized protein LOC108369544 isoform X1 [Rhagoletis zephyria]XP_017480156.1 PREDICTED: uncharacterized protein LOC108369544 isoform X1 [Rhagoletis zephyria]
MNSENKEKETYKNSDCEQTRTTESKSVTNREKEKEHADSVCYTKRHRGDYCVLVDTSKSNTINNEKMRNGIFLWDIIRHFNIEGIKNIKAIGRSLYKIFFENYEAANKCVSNPDLIKNQMRPFIPRSLVETTGVARQIPLNFTEEEIKENIISDIPVTAISRITRRDPNDKEKFIPTLAVKISFEGNELPETIDIFCVKIKMVHYIPRVRHCYNCGRLGHTNMACRAANRCIICGKATTNSCILRGGDNHNSLESRKCSKWAREKQVVEIMTIKKVSKSEAIGMYNLNNNNRFSALENYEGNFPQLEAKSTARINNDETVNRKLTSYKYNYVVRNHQTHTTATPNPPKILPKATTKTQPVYEMQNWSKVTEIEKLVNLLIKRYDIDVNDPLVNLIRNIGAVHIEDKNPSNKDDKSNKNITI